MLAQHVDIGLGDCVRIEGAVRLVGRVGVSRAAHTAINNEMGDVNALGPQLARRALRQSAQSKLSHGEGRGERESFDARGRSGEQDGTPPAGHHALCGLLGDEEAAEGSDGDCLLHRGRIEVGDWPVRPGAGIVDDEIGLAETLVDFVEKLGDGTCFGRIHRESGCAGFSGECIQLADIARGEADLHVKRCQAPSERRADTGPGADDQGIAIGKVSHIVRPSARCWMARSARPKVAICLNDLAGLLSDTNRLAEAEQLMRRALEIDEASYAPSHPDLALRLYNLAGFLYRRNRFAEELSLNLGDGRGQAAAA
jgi:Tetratricopeptide repeat